MAQFRSKPFGVTKSGEKVNEYIISNPGGLEVHVLNYGCVIKNILVPTKKGPVDVVIGHDTLTTKTTSTPKAAPAAARLWGGTPTGSRTRCSV